LWKNIFFEIIKKYYLCRPKCEVFTMIKKKIQANKLQRVKRSMLIQKQQKRLVQRALVRFGSNLIQAAVGFSVQTGSFGSLEAAQSVAATLEFQFKQPILLHVIGSAPSGVCSVLVGQFRTLAEAEKVQIELKNEGINGFVRDLNSL
jgi:cell division protein FtsN